MKHDPKIERLEMSNAARERQIMGLVAEIKRQDELIRAYEADIARLRVEAAPDA